VRIEAEQALHHCTDGRIKKEYLLSEPISREAALRMADFGTVELLEFLPKPMFSLVRKPDLNIRGILGKRVIEVWYEPDTLETAEREVYELFDRNTGATTKAQE